MGKNRASRQQDAHGPEKDDWLDPGNGEREGEEGEILHHSCVRIEKKKILFWSTDKRFVALSAGRKEVEGQLATAGVKCSCGGDSN